MSKRANLFNLFTFPLKYSLAPLPRYHQNYAAITTIAHQCSSSTWFNYQFEKVGKAVEFYV